MNYKQLVSHYGTLSKAARALELARQTVFAWQGRNGIPERWQIRIAAHTDGKLKPSKAARRSAEEFAALLRRPGRAKRGGNGAASGNA